MGCVAGWGGACCGVWVAGLGGHGGGVRGELRGAHFATFSGYIGGLLIPDVVELWLPGWRSSTRSAGGRAGARLSEKLVELRLVRVCLFGRGLRIGIMVTGWRFRRPRPRVAYLDRPGHARGVLPAWCHRGSFSVISLKKKRTPFGGVGPEAGGHAGWVAGPGAASFGGWGLRLVAMLAGVMAWLGPPVCFSGGRLWDLALSVLRRLRGFFHPGM
jgi:hypothetical protein